MKELVLSEEKTIRIYVGLFPLGFRSSAYEFALASNFTIGWNDGVSDAQLKHKYLHSVFSVDDVERLGVLHFIAASEAAKELDGYRLSKAILNLTSAADAHFVHVHGKEKILLYYVNLAWEDGWHGETLFFDHAGKEIVFASPYTPGRLTVFQGDTPHAMRPQSSIADKFRFSLALFFDKC